jgi:cytochrome c peroxidase
MKTIIVLTIALLAFFFIRASSGGNEPGNREELGRLLFFDPILSATKTISCASCHKPEYAFADNAAVSTGVNNRKGTRNTPSAMNLKSHETFFWDGRASTLEEQALAPIENPSEMNLPVDIAVGRLQNNKSYAYYFKKIYNSRPTRALLADALAAFEKTLETSDSPFDNWKFYDDSTMVSASVRRGFDVFNGRGKCVHCHFGSDLTRNEFRNIGLFNGRNLNDSGRYVITKSREDIGKFKTPGLRNIALTAPYMHNGMLKTLKEVIEFYDNTNKKVSRPVNKDTLLAKPLGLTGREKADLEAFLVALTDKQFSKGTK